MQAQHLSLFKCNLFMPSYVLIDITKYVNECSFRNTNGVTILFCTFCNTIKYLTSYFSSFCYMLLPHLESGIHPPLFILCKVCCLLAALEGFHGFLPALASLSAKNAQSL